VQIVSVSVSRPLEACWRVFVDPSTMTAWVPGLQAARLVGSRPDGLPGEIQFEFIAGLSYALIYTYDVDARVVRWEPREAARGGVRGFARFEVAGDKTCVTYALEHDGGRKAAERALDDPRTLVEAFARWMHEDRD